MIARRNMTREIGTALAVLAIYLLTVLAPLHQARASQLAFEELGYSTLESGWVLCTPAGVTGQDPDAPPIKCPATGVGKDEIVPPSLAVLAVDAVALPAPLPQRVASLAPAIATPPTGSRAPPTLV